MYIVKCMNLPKITNVQKDIYFLPRDFTKLYPLIVKGEGSWLTTNKGVKIFDASGGAAVSCLGHGNQDVGLAMNKVLVEGIPYLSTAIFANKYTEQLAEELIKGTGYSMSKVYLTGSGSEAVEGALKAARLYFYEQDSKTTRVNYITRDTSYHGTTAGALSATQVKARRAAFIPLLNPNMHTVSSCNPYRQRHEGETDASFVARKALELDKKFQELGANTVIGFLMEPVVGAALGAVPYVPGYLKAMRDVCHKHGALFILDEVMCGMGRTGFMHA